MQVPTGSPGTDRGHQNGSRPKTTQRYAAPPPGALERTILTGRRLTRSPRPPVLGLYRTDPDTGRRKDQLAWLRAEDVYRVLRPEDIERD
jgi:hypothetical protein